MKTYHAESQIVPCVICSTEAWIKNQMLSPVDRVKRMVATGVPAKYFKKHMAEHLVPTIANELRSI